MMIYLATAALAPIILGSLLWVFFNKNWMQNQSG